mgnify:CR=1 FL=1
MPTPSKPKAGPNSMRIENEMARNLLQQEPGRGAVHASAANTSKVTDPQPKHQKPAARYWVEPTEGEPFGIVVFGREAWALNRLREAGVLGLTPMSDPAPRWSAYVFNLRELGVEIETVREPHGGDYPGFHGRYVLRSDVVPGWKGGAS